MKLQTSLNLVKLAAHPTPDETTMYFNILDKVVYYHDGTNWVSVSEHTGTTGSLFFAGSDGKPTEDNANLFWDSANKRLGVGTTNPTEKLEINGAVKIGNNGGVSILFPSGRSIRERNSSQNSIMFLDMGDIRIRDGNAFPYGAGLSVGGNKFVVKNNANGFVGIGTINPVERFEVVGKGKFSSTVSGADAINNNDFVTKQQLDSSLISGTTGSVFFAGSAGGVSESNANFFWDDTNKRLGLNNIDPSETLDVLGNITSRLGDGSGTITGTVLKARNELDIGDAISFKSQSNGVAIFNGANLLGFMVSTGSNANEFFIKQLKAPEGNITRFAPAADSNITDIETKLFVHFSSDTTIPQTSISKILDQATRTIRNNGSGKITITLESAQKINGVATTTFDLEKGESIQLLKQNNYKWLIAGSHYEKPEIKFGTDNTAWNLPDKEVIISISANTVFNTSTSPIGSKRIIKNTSSSSITFENTVMTCGEPNSGQSSSPITIPGYGSVTYIRKTSGNYWIKL